MQQQPQAPVEVNWSHPSAKGLLFAWPGSQAGNIDIVGGRRGVVFKTGSGADQLQKPLNVSGVSGMGYIATSATSANSCLDFGVVNAGDPLSGAVTQALTVLGLTNYPGTATYCVSLADAATNGTGGWAIKTGSSNYFYALINGTAVLVPSVLNPAAGFPGIFALTSTGGTAVTDRQVQNATYTRAFPVGSGKHLTINGVYNLHAAYSRSGTLLVAIWDRRLGISEMRALLTRPWDLFVRRRNVKAFNSGIVSVSSVEMAGLLTSLIGSPSAGYIVTVNKGGELTGYVTHTAGHHISVAVPADLTGNLLVSGSSQIAVSVPGTLTANASPTAGQYVTVQITAESLTALGEILGVVSLSASVAQSGVLTAASGQVSASFEISVNQLNATLTALGALSGQYQIAVSVGGSLLSTAQLTAAHYTSANVQGQVFSADGTLLGAIEIGGVVNVAGLLQGGSALAAGQHISVARPADLSGLGAVSGAFAEGRVILDATLSAQTSLSAGFYTSVFVTGALTGYAGLAGELAQNVLIAADALIAQGVLSGTVRVLGPAILTGIGPGLAGASQQFGLTTLTPAYVVVSITTHEGVTSH